MYSILKGYAISKRSNELYIKQKHFALNFTGYVDNLCKIYINKKSNKLDGVQINHKRLKIYMIDVRMIKFDSDSL